MIKLVWIRFTRKKELVYCIVCDRSHCTNRDMIHCSCVLFTKNCVQFLALKRRFIMYHMTAAECSKAYVSQCIICFFFLTQKNHVERRKNRIDTCHAIFLARKFKLVVDIILVMIFLHENSKFLIDVKSLFWAWKFIFLLRYVRWKKWL